MDENCGRVFVQISLACFGRVPRVSCTCAAVLGIIRCCDDIGLRRAHRCEDDDNELGAVAFRCDDLMIFSGDSVRLAAFNARFALKCSCILQITWEIFPETLLLIAGHDGLAVWKFSAEFER